MNGKRGVIAAAVALAAAFVLMVQTGASGRGPLKLAGQGSTTEARFGLDLPTDGPFPSDWFTVPDHTNKTHRRVSLPLPDCQVQVSDCEDIKVLNELDGFNLQPRLSVPFSGPIDPNTVTSHTVFLVSLGSPGPGQDDMPPGAIVGIDQTVWDPPTNTLHVESDELLDQHTRYVLVVTKDVRDAAGRGIKPAKEFLHFVDDAFTESTGDPNLDAYRTVLRGALMELDTRGIVPRGQIVAASVFSTQSATAVLEKIRDQIHAATPDPADFRLGPNGGRTVFGLNQITSITWSQQTQVDPPVFTASPVNLSLIRNNFPSAVAGIAFGRYLSPDYEVHPGEYIPPIGTRSGTPAVNGTNEIYFNLFLPSGARPAGGWPVAILVHGISNSKETTALTVASSMAKYGIATVAINNVGHGSGPLSTLTVSRSDGAPMTFPAGGRGIDQNGDNLIGSSEGLDVARPRAAVFLVDGYRQTAADLMQLVRVIGVGMDVDGDGQRDLDPARVYLFGNSLGGGIGTIFFAVEPDVQAGVLSVPFDPIPSGILSCVFRNTGGDLLGTRQPSVLNPPGIQFLDGCKLTSPFFDENFPLRNQTPLTVQLEDSPPTTRVIQSPVTNTVAGAMAIQQTLENLKWAGQAGSPLAYAPHLRKAPLAGVAAKSVLFLMAKGDQSAPNPSTTAILRAGDLADRTLYYRHDLYYQSLYPSGLTKNPHGFVTNGISNALLKPITLGAQDMIGNFFHSDGTVLPEPRQFFEFPIILPLPEGLNYIQ